MWYDIHISSQKGNRRLTNNMGHRILAIKTTLFLIAAFLLALLLALPFGVDVVEASEYYQQYYDTGSYAQGSYGGYDYDDYYNSYNNYDDHDYDGYDYASSYGYGSGYQNYGYQHYARPSCALNLSYRTSNAGVSYYSDYLYAPATLTWTTSYATNGYITPEVGSVGQRGSRIVQPYGNQSYVMTVYGPGGSSTCQVTAVSPYRADYFNRYSYAYRPTYQTSYPYSYGYGYTNYSNYPTYNYPTLSAQYVPLTQVPYTGADFGPLGNSLMWLFVVIAAALGAGAIAYRGQFVEKVLVRHWF